MNTQINGEADRIADGLAAQVTIEDGMIATLNDATSLEPGWRHRRRPRAPSNSTAWTREAKAQRDLLDSYLHPLPRCAASRTDAGSALPRRADHHAGRAARSFRASPKTALITGELRGLVALALQIGGVLFFGELMSGRSDL